MFRIIRRDKPREMSLSQRRRSQDSPTAGVDARLPDRPSLEGYKVEALPLDHAMSLFKDLARDHFEAHGRTSESESNGGS